MKTNNRLCVSPLRRTVSSVLLLIGVACSASSLQAVPPASARPRLELGRTSRGEDAVALLGPHLPDVALAYGLKPEVLVRLLRQQPSLWVDAGGALLYVCAGPGVKAAGPAAESSTVAAAPVAAPTAAVPGTFALHSTPGATRTLYLDFTGHTTAGTAWNSMFTGGADIVSAPFDLDGTPDVFGEAECALIRGVWQRVAADFAPFAIDVTTEDPGPEALRATSAGDTAYGQRVVISPTNWYNAANGGVSYVGTFQTGTETPNFVFSAQLANGEKYIAEAVSHESGHALGLNHAGLGGSSPTEYYAGQGDWAPIMGNSYYRPVTQWSRGEYRDANNTDDQLATMQAYGAPLVADTYGTALADAAPLSAAAFPVLGTIRRETDSDVFRFNTGAGAIAFALTSPAPEPNLNLAADLLDSAGTVLRTAGPALASLALDATVPAGTYYLRVRGSGSGDPLTTGYSRYGSLGDYLLTGTLVPSDINTAPVAVAAAAPGAGTAPLPVAFSSAGSFDPDGTIAAWRWDFGDGTTSDAASPAKTYTVAGNYTARLTVTDNLGATGSATVAISVAAAPAPGSTDADLAAFALTTAKAQSGTTATAALTVRDRLGRPVAGATVTLAWSGLVSGTASGLTDATGTVRLTSGRSKKSGNVTATVTGVTPPAGAAADPTLYAEPMQRTVRFN